MYNSITVVGNLGQDPTTHNSNNGSNFVTFSIAVNEDSKGTESTMWLNVVCFKSTADFVSKYMKKGHRVLVEGKLRIEEYTPKDSTEKRTAVKIVANKIVSLTSKKEGEATNGATTSKAVGSDADIPF